MYTNIICLLVPNLQVVLLAGRSGKRKGPSMTGSILPRRRCACRQGHKGAGQVFCNLAVFVPHFWIKRPLDQAHELFLGIGCDSRHLAVICLCVNLPCRLMRIKCSLVRGIDQLQACYLPDSSIQSDVVESKIHLWLHMN